MSEASPVTVWWFHETLAEGDIPVPYERKFTSDADALAFMRSLSKTRQTWIKAFRVSEHNIVARWSPEQGWYDTTRSFADLLGQAERAGT